MWTLALIAIGLLIFYYKIVKIYNYWEDNGVPFIKPIYIFGNFAETVFLITSTADLFEKIYNQYRDVRYVGFYQFLNPVLMIRDPELIKKITIKDFETFPEHQPLVPVNADPLWSKNLFAMQSKDGWHEMRTTLSASFTSSKMRRMFPLMQECSNKFGEYLKTKDGLITIEAKDFFSRFGNDVNGSTAFGITCNSLKERDNELYLMGKEATNFSGIKCLKFLLYSLWPSLMMFLNVKIFNTKVSNFFRGVINETLRIREEKKIIRPDMIHLLMEARKGRAAADVKNEHAVDEGFAAVQEFLSNENITSQALLFFFAGFDAVSTAMCYITYELAINSNIQTKLRDEIKKTLEKSNGTITYETLLSMKYLDNVISETLRLHPPNGVTDRICIKPYVIEAEKPGEKSLYLQEDTVIWIPIRGIHRDAKYFTNPEKFDPERFNDENKHKIKPFTYLPFGVGPRNCIGSRFALLQCKLIITELLQKYELVPVEKTEIPLKLDPYNAFPLPKNGFWLGLNPIIESS